MHFGMKMSLKIIEKLCEIIVHFCVDFEIPKGLKNDVKIDAEKKSKIELFF